MSVKKIHALRTASALALVVSSLTLAAVAGFQRAFEISAVVTALAFVLSFIIPALKPAPTASGRHGLDGRDQPSSSSETSATKRNVYRECHGRVPLRRQRTRAVLPLAEQSPVGGDGVETGPETGRLGEPPSGRRDFVAPDATAFALQ
jgi:hypothetical protein